MCPPPEKNPHKTHLHPSRIYNIIHKIKPSLSFVPPIQHKSSGLKFCKFHTGSQVTYSCHRNSSLLLSSYLCIRGSPDLPGTRIARSTIPFRKCFKSCSPMSDLATHYGPQATTRFTCLVLIPLEHEPSKSECR